MTFVPKAVCVALLLFSALAQSGEGEPRPTKARTETRPPALLQAKEARAKPRSSGLDHQTIVSKPSGVPSGKRDLSGDALARAVALEQQINQLSRVGRFDLAIEPAREAAEVRTRVQGANHWQAADAWQRLEELHKCSKLPEEGRRDLVVARVLHEMAFGLASPAEALPLWTSVIAKYGKWFGSGYPAETRYLLARDLAAISRYSEAEVLLRKALSVEEQVLGVDHPQVAGMYECFIGILLHLEKYNDAEPVLRKLLAIHQKISGEDDPHVTDSLHYLAHVLRVQGRYAEAEPLYRRVLIRKLKMPAGENDLGTAMIYTDFAGNLGALARHAEAEALFRKALAIRQKSLGESDPETIDTIENLAGNLVAQGRFAEAEPFLRKVLATHEKDLGLVNTDTLYVYSEVLYYLKKYDETEAVFRKLLSIRQKALGEDHPHTADSLHDLANILSYVQKRYLEAERLYRRALTLRLKTLGENDLDTAKTCSNLADNLTSQSRHAEAEPLFRQAQAIRQKLLGESDPETIGIIEKLAGNLVVQGRPADAEPLLRKAFGFRQKALGLDHPNTRRTYNELTTILLDLGKLVEAELFIRELLAIHEKAVGDDDPGAADAYRDLANVVLIQGRPAEAEFFHRRALTARLRAAGENDPATAGAYRDLAGDLILQGKFTEAEPLFRKALALHQKVLGEGHPKTVECRSGYANILCLQGKLAEAEAIHRKALANRLLAVGDNHLETATCSNDLANTLISQGKLMEAESQLRQARAIRWNRLGESDRLTVQTSVSLAFCLQKQGKLAEAETIYRRTLDIWITTLGEDHPNTGVGYLNVASVVFDQGKHAEAEPLLHEALARCQKNLGDDHFITTNCYHKLASGLEAQRKFGEAEHLWRKVLSARIKVFGRDNSSAGASFSDLASNLDAQGKLDEAVENWTAAAEISERTRGVRGASGLERSLSTAFSCLPSLSLALARQGRSRDAWARWESHLARGLLDDLSAQQLRPLTPDQRDREADLNRRLQSLDERIAPLADKTRRTPSENRELVTLRNGQNELRGQWVEFQNALDHGYQASVGKPSTLAQVQKALAVDTALVGWLDEAKHHWACIVRSQGDPIWVPVPVPRQAESRTNEDDERCVMLRKALVGDSPEWRGLAKTLASERIMPLLPHLKGVNHLIVLPSEALMGVPIEALIAALPEGSPSPVVSYAPSGSMLARLTVPRSQPAAAPRLFAIGDPAFPGQVVIGPATKPASDANLVQAGVPTAITSKITRAQQLAADVLKPDVRAENLIPLPGTRHEVQAIAGLFPAGKATTLLGTEAIESNVQRLAESGQLKNYRYVHLATHGKSDATVALRSALFLAPEPSAQTPSGDLAGLAAVPDGQITAEQIVRTWELDADLVVISACESGLGRKAGGEGYVGFAQALFVKGARSLVLSQWRVDDRATALLMTRFYQNLLGKREGLSRPMPKVKALDEAKHWLRGLSSAEVGMELAEIERGTPRSKEGAPVAARPYEHPYYWAAFILVGIPN